MSSPRGFTLLELAVVLVIVGTMLTLGIAAFNAQVTTSAYTKTKAKMEVIKDALIVHLAIHDRLPCPDTIDTPANMPFNGKENCGAADYGVVPFAQLGLPPEAVIDGWDNLIYYKVSSGTPNWTVPRIIAPTDAGSIVLQTRDNSGNLFDISTQLVAVLISHGKNGQGAFTKKGTRTVTPSSDDESENTDDDNTFVTRPLSEDTSASGGGTFDDLVVPVSSGELIGPLIKSGQLKSLLLNESFRSGEALLFAKMVRNGCAVPNTSSPEPDLETVPIEDPWDRALVYKTEHAGTKIYWDTPTSTPIPIVASLISRGPDGIYESGDDESFDVHSYTLESLAARNSVCSTPPPPP